MDAKDFNPEKWMSAENFARRCNVTKGTILIAIKKQEIEALMWEKRWMIPERELQRFIERRKQRETFREKHIQ